MGFSDRSSSSFSITQTMSVIKEEPEDKRKSRGEVTMSDHSRTFSDMQFQMESSSTEEGSDQELDSCASDTSVRCLFKKARYILDPTALYRFIMYLFAERKLVVFFGIHFVSTMIVWAHFALIKYERQLNSVPEGASRYNWKLTLPPLEFGSMHAILFQMALIPLTMSRFSIAAMSDSFLNRVIPLNRALRMHIHLGYTMVLIVFLATVFFFAFFGMLCTDGEEKFCKIFTSEIMITGYSIMASLLIIGGTSYFRHHIPHELFYAIHHLVFILYFITIAHTIDVDQRKGATSRSQTFKWFSSTLLFYFCDRFAMHFNHRYETRMISSSTVTGSNGSRMIILQLNRPALFRFKPGQYAILQIGKIDKHWHPFSIASGPDSSKLEFYVQVFGDKSWTGKLWKLLEMNNGDGKKSPFRLDVSVMGPYGTSLAKTEDFSHALALGAGTGIVPILSLLKQHVRQMLHYDPSAFFADLSIRAGMIQDIELAREKKKGCMMKRACSLCSGPDTRTQTRKDDLRSSIRERLTLHDSLQSWNDVRNNRVEMQKAASRATRSMYGVVLLATTPVIGVSILGFSISWNTVPLTGGLFSGMVESLQYFTYVFQAIFFVVSMFIWDATEIWAYVDAVMCLICPVADYFWYHMYEDHGTLSAPQVTLFCLLTGYMTVRLWNRAVEPRHNSWKTHVQHRDSTLDRLDVVWSTRSASQVSKILPEIHLVWNSLVDAWGYENARKVCRISIHVTDPDMQACKRLRSELEDSTLDISFARLNIGQWIEDHTIDMIENHSHSYSVLAFCGSPQLAKQVQCSKISNDMLTAVIGHKQHQMEFVSESYGGPSKKKATAEPPALEEDTSDPLNNRTQTSYLGINRSRSIRNSIQVMASRHPKSPYLADDEV